MSKNKRKIFQKQKYKKEVSQFITEKKTWIPIYKQVWMEIALSCEEIEPQKASAAIKAAYGVLGKPEPEIYFCDSPIAALDILFSQLWQLQKGYSISLSCCLEQHLWQSLKRKLDKSLWQNFGGYSIQAGEEIKQLQIELGCGQKEWQKRRASLKKIVGDIDWIEAFLFEEQLLWNELLWSESLASYLEKHFRQTLIDYGFPRATITWNLKEQLLMLRHHDTQSQKLWGIYGFPLNTGIWSYYGCWLDFCASVFDFIELGDEWKALQEIVKHCGWIYPLEKFCLVCDRPRSISLDVNRMHPSYILAFKDLPQISFPQQFSF